MSSSDGGRHEGMFLTTSGTLAVAILEAMDATAFLKPKTSWLRKPKNVAQCTFAQVSVINEDDSIVDSHKSALVTYQSPDSFEFDEDFVFENVESKSVLQIELMSVQQDATTSMGIIDIPLQRLGENNMTSQWYQLMTVDTSETSRVTLRIQTYFACSQKPHLPPDIKKEITSHTRPTTDKKVLSKHNFSFLRELMKSAEYSSFSIDAHVMSATIEGDRVVTDANNNNTLPTSHPSLSPKPSVNSMKRKSINHTLSQHSVGDASTDDDRYNALGVLDYCLILGPKDVQSLSESHTVHSSGSFHRCQGQAAGTPFSPSSLELSPGSNYDGPSTVSTDRSTLPAEHGDIIIWDRFPLEDEPGHEVPHKVEWFACPEGRITVRAVCRPEPIISYLHLISNGAKAKDNVEVFGTVMHVFLQINNSSDTPAGNQQKNLTLPDQSSAVSPNAADNVDPGGGGSSNEGSSNSGNSKLWTAVSITLLHKMDFAASMIKLLYLCYAQCIQPALQHWEDTRSEGSEKIASCSLMLEEIIAFLYCGCPTPIAQRLNLNLQVHLDAGQTELIPFVLQSQKGLPQCTSSYFATILQRFGPNIMLEIFTCVLSECRMLFHSKNLALVQEICEGFRMLIYPLTWAHVFLPVVPMHLLNLLEAPVPFLLGIHSDSLTYVHLEYISDIVIVDCDLGTVTQKDNAPEEAMITLPEVEYRWLNKSLQMLYLPSEDQTGNEVKRNDRGRVGKSMSMSYDVNLGEGIATILSHDYYSEDEDDDDDEEDNDLFDTNLNKSSFTDTSKAQQQPQQHQLLTTGMKIQYLFFDLMVFLFRYIPDNIFYVNKSFPLFSRTLFLTDYTSQDYFPMLSILTGTNAFNTMIENLHTSPLLAYFNGYLEKIVDEERVDIGIVNTNNNNVDSPYPIQQQSGSETMMSPPQKRMIKTLSRQVSMSGMIIDQLNSKMNTPVSAFTRQPSSASYGNSSAPPSSSRPAMMIRGNSNRVINHNASMKSATFSLHLSSIESPDPIHQVQQSPLFGHQNTVPFSLPVMMSTSNSTPFTGKQLDTIVDEPPSPMTPQVLDTLFHDDSVGERQDSEAEAVSPSVENELYQFPARLLDRAAPTAKRTTVEDLMQIRFDCFQDRRDEEMDEGVGVKSYELLLSLELPTLDEYLANHSQDEQAQAQANSADNDDSKTRLITFKHAHFDSAIETHINDWTCSKLATLLSIDQNEAQNLALESHGQGSDYTLLTPTKAVDNKTARRKSMALGSDLEQSANIATAKKLADYQHFLDTKLSEFLQTILIADRIDQEYVENTLLACEEELKLSKNRIALLSTLKHVKKDLNKAVTASPVYLLSEGTFAAFTQLFSFMLSICAEQKDFINAYGLLEVGGHYYRKLPDDLLEQLLSSGEHDPDAWIEFLSEKIYQHPIFQNPELWQQLLQTSLSIDSSNATKKKKVKVQFAQLANEVRSTLYNMQGMSVNAARATAFIQGVASDFALGYDEFVRLQRIVMELYEPTAYNDKVVQQVSNGLSSASIVIHDNTSEHGQLQHQQLKDAHSSRTRRSSSVMSYVHDITSTRRHSSNEALISAYHHQSNLTATSNNASHASMTGATVATQQQQRRRASITDHSMISIEPAISVDECEPTPLKPTTAATMKKENNEKARRSPVDNIHSILLEEGEDGDGDDNSEIIEDSPVLVTNYLQRESPRLPSLPPPPAINTKIRQQQTAATFQQQREDSRQGQGTVPIGSYKPLQIKGLQAVKAQQMTSVSKWLLVGTNDGKIHIADMQTGQIAARWRHRSTAFHTANDDHYHGITSLHTTRAPCGNSNHDYVCFSGCSEGMIKVWTLPNLDQIHSPLRIPTPSPTMGGSNTKHRFTFANNSENKPTKLTSHAQMIKAHNASITCMTSDLHLDPSQLSLGWLLAAGDSLGEVTISRSVNNNSEVITTKIRSALTDPDVIGSCHNNNGTTRSVKVRRHTTGSNASTTATSSTSLQDGISTIALFTGNSSSQRNTPSSPTAMQHLVAVGTTMGLVSVLDINSALSIFTASGHDAKVTQLVALRQNEFISVGQDRVMRLWDTRMRQAAAKPYDDRAMGDGDIKRCAFASITDIAVGGWDNNLIISSSADGLVRLWDLRHDIKAPSTVIEAHHDRITAVKWLGRSEFYTAGYDGTVRSWDSIYNRCTSILPVYIHDHGPVEGITQMNVTDFYHQMPSAVNNASMISAQLPLSHASLLQHRRCIVTNSWFGSVNVFAHDHFIQTDER